MQMVDGEVPQPLATADEEAAREDAASAHLQHDSAKEEVTTEETYCELPAPKFHQMREYDRIFRLVVFGNGVTAGLAGRRGCARTEVENQKDIAVEFAFFRLFGISVRRQVANQFQMGQHDASTSIRIMMWRLAFAVGVDLAIWIEDGKKYTSTATRIDVEVRFPSDGFDSVYVMNWETAKDGKTGRRSAKKSVRAQFAMIPLPIMEHRMPWGAESQGVTDEQVGETDTDPPPSSFSLLIEGLREMIRLIREPLTPTTRGTQATAPNLQTSGVNAAVRGTEIGQSHLETPSRPENEAPPATTAVDLEAQPMQSDPPKTVPTKKLKGRRKRPKTPQHFVVIGIFSPLTGIPSERLVTVSKPKHLFRDLWWGIMRLRGIEAFVSLKDVKGFAVYQCDPFTPSHKRLKLDQSGKEYMAQLFQAYHSWSPDRQVTESWMNWVDTALNQESKDPKSGKMLSIELILGWSVFRISVAILTPVLLSLGIGLWLNSSNWKDNGTIQTAWGVASYIATAGAFLGALLAIISGVSDK